MTYIFRNCIVGSLLTSASSCCSFNISQQWIPKNVSFQSLVSFLTVFNICSHLFFTFDFGLSDCTTLCVQKTQRLHFSSAFPKQEQHPCSDLELLAQAFHLSTGQEVNVKGNTWKKVFLVNRHQKVLDLCASDSTVFSF